jgi:uridylate kinase
MLKRAVIKLSGEAIGKTDMLFDDNVINSIVGQIKDVMEKGTQIALVVGGGNLWRGHLARPDMDRVKADQMGMLATIMNAIYLQEAFKRQGVKAKVATPTPFGNITALYDKDTALAWMEDKTVLINAAGLGHPFFSTDTITALRGLELETDCILYAKNIDGVYDKDPKKYPDARKYQTLTYRTAVTEGLGAADISALHLSSEARMPSYVFGLDRPDSIRLACAYPETNQLQGTYITVDAKEDFYV